MDTNDTIQSLKEQSARIEEDIEKISDSLNHITENINILKPNGINKFDEETEVLEESLNDLIKLLSKGTEEQQKLLQECESTLKETTDLTKAYLEMYPVSNNEIPNDKDSVKNSENNSVCDDEDSLFGDSVDSDTPVTNSVLDEITSGYELLNRAMPKLE